MVNRSVDATGQSARESRKVTMPIKVGNTGEPVMELFCTLTIVMAM